MKHENERQYCVSSLLAKPALVGLIFFLTPQKMKELYKGDLQYFWHFSAHIEPTTLRLKKFTTRDPFSDLLKSRRADRLYQRNRIRGRLTGSGSSAVVNIHPKRSCSMTFLLVLLVAFKRYRFPRTTVSQPPISLNISPCAHTSRTG